MRTASNPALRAPFTAMVATGTPLGICTMESRLSRPSSWERATGTPMTGSVVTEASIPGRWAAPPAPAMMTRRPRPEASWPKAIMRSGVRWAETTRTSWGTSKRSSRSTAPCITGRSDELPMTTATRGVEGVMGPPAPGSARPSGTGVPRARAADQALPRTSSSGPPHTVTCPSLRPGLGLLPYRWTWAPATSRPRGRSAAGSSPPAPPNRLTLATSGWAGAVDPRGRSSTARRWFSNWEVTDPSIVQWPELWGRVATSLTRSRPPDQKSSTAITPTAPAMSATRRPSTGSLGPHLGGQAARHQHLPAYAVELRRLHRRPGHRVTRGAPSHHDGELRFEREQLLEYGAPGDAGQHRLGLRLVAHGPDALAVIAAAGRFDDERPAVGGAEVGHVSGRSRRGWVDDGIGGHRDARPVEHGAHVCLVHGHLQRRRTGPDDRALLGHRLDQGQVDLLVVEGQDPAARREVA